MYAALGMHRKATRPATSWGSPARLSGTLRSISSQIVGLLSACLGKREATQEIVELYIVMERPVLAGYLNSSIKLQLWFSKDGNQTTFGVAVFENLQIQKTSGSSFLKNPRWTSSYHKITGQNQAVTGSFIEGFFDRFLESLRTVVTHQNQFSTFWEPQSCIEPSYLIFLTTMIIYIFENHGQRTCREYQFPFLITAQHC